MSVWSANIRSAHSCNGIIGLYLKASKPTLQIDQHIKPIRLGYYLIRPGFRRRPEDRYDNVTFATKRKGNQIYKVAFR